MMQVYPFALVLALTLAGCMKPNPLVHTLGDEGDDATSSEVDGDGDPAESDSPLPDFATSQMCESIESYDSLDLECSECLGLECCDLALACAGIDECLCLADCMIGGASLGTCKNVCDVAAPNDIDELEPLLECATAACEQSC
jgi:hypothetical protein